ncbi:NAR1 ribosyltransferase, partial [Climacteris rufus]|nr:NAR1 ribosyltransferase [Climacteris rufus]
PLAATTSLGVTAPPLAATPTPTLLSVPLDMAPSSFDDRYLGCVRAMTAALPALNRSEFLTNTHFSQAWTVAAAEWRVRTSPRSPLSPAQAVAVLAYTAPLPLHRTFNAAVRAAGRSAREYRDDFHFKVLHFLLTNALRTLKDAEGGRCHHVHRGIGGVRLVAWPGRTVRFGHFASASLRPESAGAFGSDTELRVRTCQGASIREFSFFPHEEEVLIPPFETFNVTAVTQDGRGTRVWLNATGATSNFNCQWLRGDSEGTTGGGQ